jgi:hypothetical protein
MPGLVREESEGHGFFGFGWKACGVGGGDSGVERREVLAELGEEGDVASSATGNDDVDGGFAGEREHPLLNGVLDGRGREGSGCGDGVCGIAAEFLAGREESRGEFRAELFAASGLGWGLAEEFLF